MTDVPLPLTDQRAADLARQLKQWRLDRDPADVPELQRRARSGRHLTQADMGGLIGVSERWYRALESGKPVRVSAGLLARIAQVLNLGESQRTTLYLLATGQQPPAKGMAGEKRLTQPMKMMLYAQPWPAFVCDLAWDVLDCNDPAAGLFPWMRRDGNLATWILTAPEARMQLIDWERAWAQPMLAQLRMASGCQPDHPRLNQILADALDDNPTIQGLWGTTTAMYVPADGARRMHAADGEPITVQPMSYIPYADHSIHLTVFAPAVNETSGPADRPYGQAA